MGRAHGTANLMDIDEIIQDTGYKKQKSVQFRYLSKEQNGRIGGILISFPKEISNSLCETIWSKGRTAQGTGDSCLDIRIRIYALDSMTQLYFPKEKKKKKNSRKRQRQCKQRTSPFTKAAVISPSSHCGFLIAEIFVLLHFRIHRRKAVG